MTSSSLPRAPLDRGAAERALGDVAQALTELLRAGDGRPRETVPAAALFFAHLARVSDKDTYRNAAVEAARRAGELVEQVPMGVQLYGGVAGMVWPLAHLERLGIVDDAMDLGDVDDLLIECVDDGGSYDLISGTVGLGVYFLERLPAPAAAEGLRRAIRRLDETGEHDERGLRWFTGPELIVPAQREQVPAGKYDLGVAHGVPGVIAFLALALLEGAPRAPAERMLREAVRWLVALERPDASQGAYGVMIDAREPHTALNRRAAWCYGDPGVAMALLLAARALGDRDLLQRARGVARGAAVLAEHERGRVVDTSLCHGSAGLAHLFGVLGRAFDDEALRARSEAWHATTMEMRSPGEGVAGFYFAQLHEGAYRRVADSSVLQGAAGVGLSLLGALDPESDRSWDRLLLLS